MAKLKARLSRGFTLTEIIIVITIIAILLVIGLLLLLNNITKANDAKRKADISKISMALESYYTDHECYPDLSAISQCGSDALKPYLDSVPCDPVYKYPYCYFTANDNMVSGCWQEYHLLGTLKNLSDPDIKKQGCNGAGFCGWELECGSTTNRFGFNYGASSGNTSLANPSGAGTPYDPLPPGFPPPGNPGVYACTPQGNCDNYGTRDNALANGCPITFEDDNICRQYCSHSPIYRCNH